MFINNPGSLRVHSRWLMRVVILCL